MVLAYNHVRFVEAALDATFAQTYPNLRVVITDDASTDGTTEKIREYLLRTGRDDATFIAHTENVGLCATLNEVLAQIGGKYVAFISADDTQMPDRIALQTERIETLGDYYGIC